MGTAHARRRHPLDRRRDRRRARPVRSASPDVRAPVRARAAARRRRRPVCRRAGRTSTAGSPRSNRCRRLLAPCRRSASSDRVAPVVALARALRTSRLGRRARRSRAGSRPRREVSTCSCSPCPTRSSPTSRSRRARRTRRWSRTWPGRSASTCSPRTRGRASLHPLVALPNAELGAQRLRSGAWFAVAGDPLVSEVGARARRTTRCRSPTTTVPRTTRPR